MTACRTCRRSLRHSGQDTATNNEHSRVHGAPQPLPGPQRDVPPPLQEGGDNQAAKQPMQAQTRPHHRGAIQQTPPGAPSCRLPRLALGAPLGTPLDKTAQILQVRFGPQRPIAPAVRHLGGEAARERRKSPSLPRLTTPAAGATQGVVTVTDLRIRQCPLDSALRTCIDRPR